MGERQKTWNITDRGLSMNAQAAQQESGESAA